MPEPGAQGTTAPRRHAFALLLSAVALAYSGTEGVRNLAGRGAPWGSLLAYWLLLWAGVLWLLTAAERARARALREDPDAIASPHDARRTESLAVYAAAALLHSASRVVSGRSPAWGEALRWPVSGLLWAGVLSWSWGDDWPARVRWCFRVVCGALVVAPVAVACQVRHLQLALLLVGVAAGIPVALEIFRPLERPPPADRPPDE